MESETERIIPESGSRVWSIGSRWRLQFYKNIRLSRILSVLGEDSEVISKPQIRLKGKAQADEKAQHTRSYVSILKRFATQLLGLRWDFETTSRKHPC